MRLRVDFKVEYAELETRAVLVGDPAQVETVTNLVFVPRLPGTYAYIPDGKLALLPPTTKRARRELRRTP